MIDELTAIGNAELVLDKRGFSNRKLVNCGFFDGSQPESAVPERRAPHYIVRFEFGKIEDGCVLDEWRFVAMREVDG